MASTPGNPWKKVAAGLTLAFTVVAGGLYLENRILEDENAAAQETIAQQKATVLSSFECVRTPIKSGNLVTCTTTSRSLSRDKDSTHYFLMLKAQSKEGVQIFNSAVFDARPFDSQAVEDYRTWLFDQLATRTEKGFSACDAADQPDGVLPEFARAKQVFLDMNRNPATSRAKDYTAEASPETATALTQLKAKGFCAK